MTKNITISISKDKIAALPTVTYDGYISLIDTPKEAKHAIEYLKTQPLLGFDTETKPMFRKGKPNKVSLVQISTDRRSFLFRVNKLGFIDELKDLLEDESVKKVGLSLKDDYGALRRLGDFNPGGFIDLQAYVKNFGIIDNSLQRIYAIVFGGRISKSQRLSNWEAPELSQSQMAYASIDSWSCLQLYRHLSAGLFDPATSQYIVEPQENE